MPIKMWYTSAVEVLPLIAEAANRPIVVDAETEVGLGPIGGFLRTPDQIGRDAGRLAMQILNGEDASDIPITVGNPLKPILIGVNFNGGEGIQIAPRQRGFAFANPAHGSDT